MINEPPQWVKCDDCKTVNLTMRHAVDELNLVNCWLPNSIPCHIFCLMICYVCLRTQNAPDMVAWICSCQDTHTVASILCYNENS